MEEDIVGFNFFIIIIMINNDDNKSRSIDFRIIYKVYDAKKQ